MRPSQKGSKLRKIFKKMPSGKAKRFSKRVKVYKVRCAICKSILVGTSSNKKQTKMQKRPTRKFGGMLCHRCVRKIIKYKTRATENVGEIEPAYKRFL